MKSSTRPIAVLSAGILSLGAAGLLAVSSQAAGPTVTYLELATSSSGATFSYLGDVQEFDVKSNCTASDGDGSLATVEPSQDSLGFRDNGLGIKGKGPGSNCGQFTGADSLTLGLGDSDSVAGKFITDAEVDIEAKFACVVDVEYLLGGESQGAESITLADKSDCGADSGGSDNYRAELTIPLPGADEIVFTAAPGAALSLEGGAESVAKAGGLAEAVGTNASVFELTEALVIPKVGFVSLTDDSGAKARVINPSGEDIPYTTEDCVGTEACVNFKLLDGEFHRLTVYVSIPINAETDQASWAGKIDFDGNEGALGFEVGDLSIGGTTAGDGCTIDENVLDQQACITGFFYPDEKDGTGNPELAEDTSDVEYRTDVWDLWVYDPNMR